MAADVPLAETFIETDWSRYNVANPNTTATQIGRQPSADGTTYPWGLSTLNHLDIRTFNSTQQGAQVIFGTPELWQISGTASVTTSFGFNSDLNWWQALELVATDTGSFIATSVTPQILDLTQITNGILQASYPSGNSLIDLTSSYLDLSTDGFDQEIASVSLTTSTGGDNTLYIPVDEWDAIDLTQINGIRLRLTIQSTGTFYLTGLRVIDPAYQTSSIVMDNWNGWLRQDIPLDGQTTEQPVSANQRIPLVTYAASTGGSDDPMPINGSFSTIINVGDNTGTNTFTLNVRQVGGVDTSQLLLEGQTMLELSSGVQPGLTQTAEIARRMSDFQGLPLSNFQGESMLDMDAIAETVIASAIQFQFTWGSTSSLIIQNTVETNSNPYQWSDLPTFHSFYSYLLNFSITDNMVQAQIWSVNLDTLAPVELIFDTTQITDSYQFPRRPGRIGWSADFTDGGSHVRSIRPSDLMFAEYQSVPINSRTPVQATQLYVTYASDLQTWTGFEAATSLNGVPVTAPIVSANSTRTITGSSTQVYVNLPQPNQGVISNVLSLDDVSGVTNWTETTIGFSVWFPSGSAAQSPLAAYLVSDTGWYVPLSFPQISYDTWQPVTFNGPDIPPGLYQLQIVYTGTQQTTFWIDAVSVAERALTWDARANGNDPWTPFNGLVNSITSSVQVNRGTSLQIRAQARRQDAAISSKPKIVPSFAQLGKAVWPEDIAANPDPFIQPLAFTTSAFVAGSSYTSVPIQTLGQTQFTNISYFGQIGRSLLTVTGPSGGQTTFFVNGIGSTSLSALSFYTAVNLPVGSVITGLGAPIVATLVTGRQYGFSASAATSSPPSVFPYYSPYVDYIASWLWQFSDGTVLSGPNVSHTFSASAISGTPYDITLTTMDIYGSRSSNVITIEVA